MISEQFGFKFKNNSKVAPAEARLGFLKFSSGVLFAVHVCVYLCMYVCTYMPVMQYKNGTVCMYVCMYVCM